VRTIEVTATFTLRFEKRVTDEVFETLKNGADVEDIIDESEVYRRLSSEGDAEYEWDYNEKPAKKRSKR